MPTALAAKLLFACRTERGRSPNPALKSLKSSFQLLQVHCIYGTSKVLTFAKLRKNLSQTPTIQQNNRQLFRLSGKLVGASMRSKDLAIAAGGCCCRPVRPVSPDFSGFLGLSGKLVGTSMRSKDLAKVGTSMRSKDLAKASGLDLRQPQGALAEGQCGLGREGYNRTGLE